MIKSLKLGFFVHSPPQDSFMRVLTLNVHHLPALVSCPSPHQAYLHETFRDLIMTESPHVIMLQEAWSLPDDLLTSSIPAMRYIAKSNATWLRNMFPPRIATAGLMIASTLPLSNVHTISFTSGIGWDAWAAKGVLFATCRPHDNVAPLALVTAHLQSDVLDQACMPSMCKKRNARVQRNQAKELVAALNEYMTRHGLTHYLLGGDFNVDGLNSARDGRIDISELETIIGKRSLFRDVPTFPTPTYASAQYPPMSLALDHVFTSLNVLEAHVVASDPPASDHAGTMVNLDCRTGQI